VCRPEDEVQEAVLEQSWQINLHDIFFCSRSNGKLCKLGKGAFGTVSGVPAAWLHFGSSFNFLERNIFAQSLLVEMTFSDPVGHLNCENISPP